MKIFRFFYFSLFFFPLQITLSWQVNAQREDIRTINWQNPQADKIGSETITRLNFSGAVYEDFRSVLPVYHERMDAKTGKKYDAVLVNPVFVPFSPEELQNIQLPSYIQDTVKISTAIELDRKVPYVSVSFVPVRLNKTTSKPEKLVSFSIKLIESTSSAGPKKSLKSVRKSYKAHSVLSSGKWVKIKVDKEGIYKLTFSDLSSMGIANPQLANVFGNKGGMLSQTNDGTSFDDLEELAIWRGTDYILFYAPGPVRWKYNASKSEFTHTLDYYSEFEYYFVTSDVGTGKTIGTENPPAADANITVTTFNDYTYHEVQDTNFLKSGNKWYGEEFNVMNSYNFNFSFPNLVTTTPVKITTAIAVRSDVISSFTVNANGQEIYTMSNINSVSYDPNSNYDFAVLKSQTGSFVSTSDNVNVNLVYNLPNTTAKAWLDYLNINALRSLKMDGSVMRFRNVASADTGNISMFILSGASQSMEIWDVTDLLNVRKMSASFNSASSELTFKAATDTLKEFIALDFSSFPAPHIVGDVANQDLHGQPQPDLIIISYPDFLTSASQLAEIHRNIDNMKVLLVTPEQVYNEFSAGNPDIAAIRNMAKMYYDRASGEPDMPKYLLLFGDGSYDNISNNSINTNYILTYQSDNSFGPDNTFTSDDFFGLLDNGEGPDSGSLDIGVGRIPVKSAQEASEILNKIQNYISTATMNDWRNVLAFIADDPDGSTDDSFIYQTDHDICNPVEHTYPEYNFDKIYLDAFRQISGASGQRYPDANIAVADRVKKGSLIMSYIGHSNAVGLAHEQVVTMSDIMHWDNFNKLFMFVTSSCEFSQFDDYWRTSGGEFTLLNPNGGAIALLSTTRPVWLTSLTNNFYVTALAFDPEGQRYRLGDIVRIAKNSTDLGNPNTRKFILLGDPALRLAYPDNRVVTTSIIDVSDTLSADTIRALDVVNVKGIITDRQNNKLSNFNGILYPTVFDKEKTMLTLGNEGNPPYSFLVQNNILYKGMVSITNGDFSFSFIVPKDIAYDYGFGKISYYATSESTDANGYSKSFVIGGSSVNAIIDQLGPQLRLYMNDDKFVSGGITDENPKILAFVRDSSGINTVGNGIGHDITAVLDGNSNNTLVLNDYYVADLNSYRSGRVEYPFSNLSLGPHSLSLKVWDVNNNSTEEQIEFVVTNSSDLVINHLINFPNPFTASTSFYFEQNQAGVDLDILIQVFTITGRLVKTVESQVSSAGFHPEPIIWDGRGDNGNRMESGIYIYHLRLKTSNGKSADKFDKLVIMK